MITPSFTVKKEANSSVVLTATIAAPSVAEIYQQTIKKYAKTTQIKGFRKGFVPPAIIERKFGESLLTEVREILIEEALQKIFDEAEEDNNELQPLNRPVLQKADDLNQDQEFIFSVLYDIRPHLPLPPLEKIPVKEFQVEISEEDIQDKLREYQKQYAAIEDKKDPVIADEDIITATIEELDEEEKILPNTKRDNLVFPLNEAPFNLTDSLRGLKTGAHILTPPADEHSPVKKLSVDIKKVQIAILPEMNDELARNINKEFQTLEDATKEIRKNLQSQIDMRTRQLQIQDIVSTLNTRLKFEVPQSYIDRLFASHLVQMSRQFQVPLEKLQAELNLKEMRDRLLPDLSQTARRQLILQELLHSLKIEISDKEVEEYIKELAPEVEHTEEVFKTYKKNQIFEQIRYQLEERALSDWVLQQCVKITITMFSSNRKFNEYVQNQKET